MEQLRVLRDLVILLAAALPVIIVAHRLRVPTVVAFLLAGMAIGPHGLRLIAQQGSVAGLAEIGVVLLLFTIGLELSLSRVVRLGRLVLQGGGLQVLGTVAAGAALALGMGIGTRAALLSGALVALSSTAIVLKMYADRGELDTPHGRVVVGVLLFQDLCVVPLMLLIPVLAGSGAAGSPLGDFVSSLAVLAALVLGGRLLVPRVLARVVALRNREIFTLCVMFFGLAAAYVTASFDLSLAIGAFVAGLVIAESEYGLQALSDVLPFRDTFSGIFFISVGMLLDLRFLWQRPLLLAGAALLVIVLKTIMGAGATLSLGRSLRVAVIAGLGLAQVGEFSFVLAGAAVPLGLLDPAGYQLFLGASVLSMLAAPFLVAAAEPVAERVHRLARRPPIALPPQEAPEVARRQDHVIIVGFGLSGQSLARVLKAAGIPYVILEQNGQMVRRARLAREPIYFGDGARPEVLEKVGIARARVIVFAISAPAAERRGTAIARQLNPNVRIVVRTRYVATMDDLRAAGADEIVPEEFETSVEIFARVLRLYGVPTNTIEREIDAVRGEHYGVLRGVAVPNLKLDALKHLGVHAALEIIEVEAGAPALGENATTLRLRHETGATLIAVVRDGRAYYTAGPDYRFAVADTVVLVGEGEALRRACALFRAR